MSEQSESKDYTIYILRTDNNKLYIGQTNNLSNRLKRHKYQLGALFLKGRKFEIVYTEMASSLQEAMKREKQLKGWKRAKKEALIAGDFQLLKRL